MKTKLVIPFPFSYFCFFRGEKRAVNREKMG